jgi:hypothetical protein
MCFSFLEVKGFPWYLKKLNFYSYFKNKMELMQKYSSSKKYIE